MKIWEIVKLSGVFLFLLICSIQDLKEKQLSVKVLAGFGIIFLISSLIWENITPEQRIWNMLPGAAALFLAFLTKEQIGYGDGICLLIAGNLISCNVLLGAVMSGLILICICSVVLLIEKKADRKTTLPFLPFFMAGMVFQTVMKKI